MHKKSKYRVVVAEDEYLILNNIVKKITELDLGFEVIDRVQDGKAALEIVKEKVPDLLMTDIRMPLMDGLELLENVAVDYPYIKKIVISGYDEFEYAQQALRVGVVDYLLKPVKMGELAMALNKIRIELEEEYELLYDLSPDGGDDSVERVIELVEVYIRENFMEDINVNMIAQKFNYNVSYLSKVFTKYIGENPSSYLIRLRINKARQLLLNDQKLTVKEIGEIVGYPEPAYFSRIFKKYTGHSPSKFRDSKG